MVRFLQYTLIALASCLSTLASAQVATTPSQIATDFDSWKMDFRVKALASGVSHSTFETAFRGVNYNPQIVTADTDQPEFIRPIWEYLDTAVSETHISTGISKAKILRETLASIERQYGVEQEILLAIWGIETNFGAYRGYTDTIEALASAAFAGRRRTFAQTQLIAALQIIEDEEVARSEMQGGWSGAMGHTQFMPSTYLEFAVDYNRDGHRDVWSDNPADALASTANYLQRLGWRYEQPWGIEVTLPAGFDYAKIGEYDTRNTDFWNARGVKTTSGHLIPKHGPTAILLPAGASGPIFAIFPNFQIIRQYNRSISYALAVGHLSDRLDGGGPFATKWPRGESAMTSANQRELQIHLQKRGFSVGIIDGMIGPKTIEAIQAYQQSEGLQADGYATLDLLNRLRR